MSDQHESLDCNLYRCEACIQSLDEVEQSHPKKRKTSVMTLRSSSDDDESSDDDDGPAKDTVMVTDLVGNKHPPAHPSLIKRNQLKADGTKEEEQHWAQCCAGGAVLCAGTGV